MKITVVAVGRLKSGPERMLVEDYLARAEVGGRRLGLGPFRLVEIDERKARDAAAQSARLIEVIPPGASALALDERGEALPSVAFARLLGRLRDEGRSEAVFLIGGAEGHTEALRERADRVLSFGPMTWPHLLARVMLAEQLYRATTILGGLPYHRA